MDFCEGKHYPIMVNLRSISLFCTVKELIDQHASAERFRPLEGGQQPDELRVIAAATLQPGRFGFTEVVPKNQIEKVVIISGCSQRKFTCVTRLVSILGSKAGK